MTGRESNADAWDSVSHAYNQGRDAAAESIDYGPFCPFEDELQLLGSVAGMRVLDAGCGGGQNAVSLAKQGAIVTAVDSSRSQLEYAKRLADDAGVPVRLVRAEIETLAGIADSYFDHILCTNVVPYVADLQQALGSLWRVLRPSGQLTISMDHPMRSCFMDPDTSELSNYPEREYNEHGPRQWRFAGTSTALTSYDRTVGETATAIIAAGFVLDLLLEPPAPEELLDEYFPLDGALASLRNIPHTLLIVAHKPGQLGWMET